MPPTLPVLKILFPEIMSVVKQIDRTFLILYYLMIDQAKVTVKMPCQASTAFQFEEVINRTVQTEFFDLGSVSIWFKKKRVFGFQENHSSFWFVKYA
jgi:hypothetical protein